MSRFEKEIEHFLNSSVNHKIIEKTTADSLVIFAKSDKYKQEGWFNLSRSIGILGAIVLCFGVILIISANWKNLNDLTKILGFIIMLGGSHFAGLYFSNKNYQNTASCFHFLGAGLVIAGIGLMAQIFHLNGEIKDSLLIWLIMIAPLGILLKSRSIILLSVIIFTLWCDFQIESYGRGFMSGFMEIALVNTSIGIAMVLGGALINDKDAKMSSFLRTIGMFFLILWFYALGFTHHISIFNDSKELFPLIAITVVIAVNIALLLANY